MFEKKVWFEDLPNETLEVSEEHLFKFFATMIERQKIWWNRVVLKRPAPWTNNLILRDYKFTNVYRELDRNSQWQIHNIIQDENLDFKNLVWKMMVFRFFNNPDTFTFSKEGKVLKRDLFLGDAVDPISASSLGSAGIPNWEDYDEELFARFIAGIRASGQNPYTKAYLINSKAGNGRRDDVYCHKVIPTLHARMDKIVDLIRTAERPEDLIKELNSLPAVANFISHEFYQDLTYIAIYNKRWGKEFRFTQDDYTNVGPGASVGIRLIFPSLKSREQVSGIYKLRDMSERVLRSVEDTIQEKMRYVRWDYDSQKYVECEHNLTLHQIEMWLCEYQKYWKMQIGNGKQRSMFKPRS